MQSRNSQRENACSHFPWVVGNATLSVFIALIEIFIFQDISFQSVLYIENLNKIVSCGSCCSFA